MSYHNYPIKLLTATADSLDLITWRGDLQNLSQNTHVYANDFLKERETYVLLRVVYGEQDGVVRW